MPRKKALDLESPAVKVAVFGKLVEEFIESDIGVYLLKLARDEEHEATEELIKDMHERKKEWGDAQLRERIWRARNFKLWLAHAYESGLQALEVLKEEENG